MSRRLLHPSGPLLLVSGGSTDCATDCAAELAAQYAAGEAAGLVAGAASIQANWRSLAFGAPSIIRDPLSLLSGSPTRAAGVVSATLNAGVTATSIQQGAALVWPVVDTLGRTLANRNGLAGFLRVVSSALPAVGSGIRIGVAMMTTDNPATAEGLAVAIIPHPTAGYLAVCHNGSAGSWSTTAAGTALTGTVRGVAGGWARLPGGSSQVYRNLSAAPFDATGTPSGATATGVSVAANKTAAAMQITHVALVFMTTAPLGVPTDVEASVQAAILDLNHADLAGVA